jgi:hypothetical protein
MAMIGKNIKNSLSKVFGRRTEKKTDSHAEDSKVQDCQKPVVFDTITLESIVSSRGQNPFPEEEGEMRFMNHTLRERSLLSR